MVVVTRHGDGPTLRVGQHLTFDDGACLMELVSAAVGEPWSDHPARTHPLVAHVARRVNDATSDRRRADLADFIPALTQANAADPHAYARIAAACTQVALAAAPSSLLRILHAAAARRCGSGDTRRHVLYSHGAAFRSVDLAVFAVQRRSPDAADDALRAMLVASLRAVHGARDVPASPGVSAPLTGRR